MEKPDVTDNRQEVIDGALHAAHGITHAVIMHITLQESVKRTSAIWCKDNFASLGLPHRYFCMVFLVNISIYNMFVAAC